MYVIISGGDIFGPFDDPAYAHAFAVMHREVGTTYTLESLDDKRHTFGPVWVRREPHSD